MPKILDADQIGDFRDRLIDVAERLFAARGPEAVSLRQLTAELGVSPMTPYRYFKDKDDILAAVRARAFDRFAQSLEEATASATDPAHGAQAAAQAYSRFALAHPDAYRLMFDLAQPCEQDYPDLVRASIRARATLTAPIEPLIDAGILAGEPALVAHAYWAALHGLIGLHMAGKLGPEVTFDAVGATLFAALGRGFQADSA